MFLQSIHLRSRAAQARLWLTGALLAGLSFVLVPAGAQGLGGTVANTRLELTSRVWGSGHWVAFGVDEDLKDLNGNGNTRDTILYLCDLRNFKTQMTRSAISFFTADGDTDWPVAISGDKIAIQVCAGDNLESSGVADDDVLMLYDPLSQKRTSLGVTGHSPTWLGGKLYFVQPERTAKQDLNGDGDMNDSVLCCYDPATRKIESLGMDASGGFQAAGDWIAARTSERAQGDKDLNGNGIVLDTVIQLYQVSTQRWTNTGLEGSFGIALTPQLLAVGVNEQRQSRQDLNNDGDLNDIVCEVCDLTAPFVNGVPSVTNTGQDCSGGICADGDIVGIITSETAQGGRDLTGNGVTNDQAAQCFLLSTKKVVNLAHDAFGGMVAGGGKLAFACSEYAQQKDLNDDGDLGDFVLMVYDPVANRIHNSKVAVDGNLSEREGTLMWRCLETDQGDTDLNGDGDTEDSVVFVMDLKSETLTCTRMASDDYFCATGLGGGFGVPETDQGHRDLNGDGGVDSDIAHVIRLRRPQ